MRVRPVVQRLDSARPWRAAEGRTGQQLAVPDIDRLRPAGTKRSSKRDQIVNVFLRQEGHLSADDLVDLIKREDHRISRATVYRTLQWMVDAGIARKVDFGEGRFRFEHSYRHPRHFHLICKTCNRSYEFLSSDIEALVEEIAAARGFTARQSVVQIYGTCESCRTGKPPAEEGATSELLFARDALRIAIATERSGLEFYARAARITKDPRGRQVFQNLAEEEKHHLGHAGAALQTCCSSRIRNSSRVPRSCFSKARQTDCFRVAPTSCSRTASTISRPTASASAASAALTAFSNATASASRIPKGKQIFLEFAEEERDHLELLIREYRALTRRQRKNKAKPTRRTTRRHAASRPSTGSGRP